MNLLLVSPKHLSKDNTHNHHLTALALRVVAPFFMCIKRLVKELLSQLYYVTYTLVRLFKEPQVLVYV